MINENEELKNETSEDIKEQEVKEKEEVKAEEKTEASTSTERTSVFPEHGPIAPNGKEILVSLKNVDITFGKGERTNKAVKNATFDIYKGETFSLVGESGSGKTTIGRAIIRINPVSAGEIDYKGVKISGKLDKKTDREVIRNIQMVFQDPAASLNERATVEYIISEGLYNFNLFENEADRIKKVENIIQEVGLLPEHLTRYPHEFSGGQRQRIGLARAIVMEPEFIVADEPISALDVSIRAQVLNLLKKFQKERGITYLFIAHDLSIVRFISDRIGVIYKGDIVEIADAEELFDFPLHPYTRSLISAIPIPDPELEKNKVLFTYDGSCHDYSVDKPEMVDIGHNHLIYGNKAEIEEYKRIREAGIHPKSITIKDENYKEPEPQEQTNEATEAELTNVNDYKIHDTGSKFYLIIGFFFSIIGLVMSLLFKKFEYYKNYKSGIKGTIYGAIFKGVIIVLWLIALIYAAIA